VSLRRDAHEAIADRADETAQPATSMPQQSEIQSATPTVQA